MEETRKDDSLSTVFSKTLTLDSSPSTSLNDDVEEDEEFEFAFIGGGELSSPVAAEEVFKDGQIRIIAPVSGDDEGEPSSTTSYDPKVKKLFVVENDGDDAAEGPYCVWKSPVPEMSQKSNSTGFSKIWKVRDLLARSNSDGKDAFVFLTGKSVETRRKDKEKVKVETVAYGGERKEEEKKKEKEKNKTKKKSAYEELYGDKKKGGGKSYLPYRQDLVGFFTNGTAFTRNVHPY